MFSLGKPLKTLKTLLPLRTALALVAALIGGSATAAAVNIGNYNLISGSEVVTFNELPVNLDLANGTVTGALYDSVLYSGGVAFGEHFSGQTLGASGNFDVLSGTPSGPLSLLAGAAGQNLQSMPARVIDLPTQQFDSVLAGVGTMGNTANAGIGEGAISILFSSNQSQLGLQLVGVNGGTTFFSFFRADGSLIDTVSVRAANNSFVGLFRDGLVQDIRGVSIWNNDPNGMSIDNLKHDVVSTMAAVSPVPEADTASMMAAGLLAVFFIAGRERHRTRRLKDRDV